MVDKPTSNWGGAILWKLSNCSILFLEKWLETSRDRSLESWFGIWRIMPKRPYFRLVCYYNLPRKMVGKWSIIGAQKANTSNCW